MIKIKNRWTGELIITINSLSNSDLSGANLRGARINENTAFLLIQCPEEGDFICFKKASNTIVKLLIPEDALRSSATSYKCRASKAVVLEIQELDGTKSDIISICSSYDNSFVYEVGKTVEVDDFDTNRFNGCSTGIHFFINREEQQRIFYHYSLADVFDNPGKF